MLIIQHGAERVQLYAAGGESYEQRVPGFGWVVDDEPRPEFLEYVARVVTADLRVPTPWHAE